MILPSAGQQRPELVSGLADCAAGPGLAQGDTQEDFVQYVIEQVNHRKAAEDAFFARLDDADLDIDANPNLSADPEGG